MRWILGGAVMLGLIALMMRDTRNPFDRMRSEWNRTENGYFRSISAAKTAEEHRKLTADEHADRLVFAGRCVDLARSDPDSAAGLAALCWAALNAPGSAPAKEALALLRDGRLDRIEPGTLAMALEAARTASSARPLDLVPSVLTMARHHLDDPATAKLLTWVCARQFGDRTATESPSFAEAADLIADRFAASPDISNFCEALGIGTGSPPWAGRYERHLRTILERNRTRLVRCTASFALASIVEGTGEARQGEAEGLYRRFLRDFDASDPSTKHVEANFIHSAKLAAETLRTRGLGMPATALAGVDLDGRPIDLDDFRGKVVLLTFWATWCGPCMELIPHERALAAKYRSKPFAIAGVNGDRDPAALRRALAAIDIPWRSFRDERPGGLMISEEWKVSGWPTLYLIDHNGIIRHRWVGSPGDEILDRNIEQLVDAASKAK